MSSAEWICDCGYRETVLNKCERQCPICGMWMTCDWDERDDHYLEPEDEEEDDE